MNEMKNLQYGYKLVEITTHYFQSWCSKYDHHFAVQTTNSSFSITVKSKDESYGVSSGNCIVNFLTRYWHYYKEQGLQSKWIYTWTGKMNIVHVGIKILHCENCGLECNNTWRRHTIVGITMFAIYKE